MKKLHLVLLFLMLNSILRGFGQDVVEQQLLPEDVYSFNADSLLHHVRTLSSDVYEGRRTGTKGSERAQAYIIERFKSFNLLPLATNYQQLFSFQAREKNYSGTNVLGYVKGSMYPDDYIVLSAHYDHEGIKNEQIYNGADDNASGVGALLIFSEYFQKNKPKHSIILAAFDAEEIALDGSQYYINNTVIPFEQIKLNINMDMISRNDKNELFVAGTAYNDELKSVVSKAVIPKNLTLKMGHDGKDGLQDWTYSGDHNPFHRSGIPFLYFGVEDHKDYHQPTDDFENINIEFYKKSVETIISVFNLVDKLRI